MTTPAQEAKEYAAANGFTITPNGRRYVITYPEAQYDTHVGEVGGYPAALNMMRNWVAAMATSDPADPVAIHTEPRIGGALTDGLPQREPEQSDHAYRQYLLYGSAAPDAKQLQLRVAPHIVTDQFKSDVADDINGESGQPGRFRITSTSGTCGVIDDFETRGDALKYVRRHLAGVRGVVIEPVRVPQ